VGKKLCSIRISLRYTGVETRPLTQAVRRNADRFPDSFMFQLSPEEAANMRSQIATASKRNIRCQPLAFTEHGVVMLSSVLNSHRAVQVSISVVETFIRLRELTSTNKDVLIRVEKLERGHDRTASVIEILVDDIDRIARDVKQMKNLPSPSKRKYGFDL
jgi:ORF6N domain